MVSLLSLIILISKPVYADFGSIVDIGLAGDLYFTHESANNGQGFVNLLIQNTWEESQLWVDIGAGGLVGDTASSYLKAPQFFYRLGKKNRSHFVLGRHKHQWSFLDQFWNMGLTQPIFKWNQAIPEQQGLTGLFWTTPVFSKNFELTLFGSFLYIPTQGPSYDLSDGKLTSSNPWFNEPVEILNLSGNKAKLNFDIDVPKTQDIVAKNRESIGGQIATPMNKRGFLFNVFFMSKPRNELILPFEGLLNLTTFDGDITVFPQVAQHTVKGVDIGWHFKKFKTLFSWLYESDVRYTAPGSTTYPLIPKQNIYSFQQLFRLSRTQRIWVGYLNADRENNQVAGTYANTQISTFDYRNRFDEAIRVRWEGLLFKSLNKYRLKANVAYTQNLKRNNMWVSADIKWSIYKGLEAFSHCDFFGGSETAIIGTDFISAYQNNDRCLVGGHYAF